MNQSCYRHSDREGSFFCQKDGRYMCRECACCHSPRIYCQYRTACMIDLLTKEGDLEACEKKIHHPDVQESSKPDATGTLQ